MTQVDQKIIARIVSLMERTKRGQHESDLDFINRQGEVENALSLAFKLMRQHNIDIMDLPDGEASLKEDVTHVTTFAGRGVTFGIGWCLHLGQAVAKCTYTKVIFWGKDRICFIGSHTDSEVAAIMYGYISVQMTTACKIIRKVKELKGGTAPYKKFTVDFMTGCAMRVAERIQEEISRENSTAGTSLVKVTEERNEKYKEDILPPTKQITTRSKSINRAFVEGWDEADKIKIQEVKELS